MEFLSNLSTMQRGAGAAILVLLLVLLLVKQRQSKGATATTSEATPEKAQKQPKAPKQPKQKGDKPKKSFSMGRKRKDGEPAEPAEEPKSGSGRMVPRLPAAAADDAPFEDVPAPEFERVPDPAEGPSVPVADGDDMISEPGWPTPGEVWAAPGSAARIDGDVEDAETWLPSTNGVGEQDDALAALTEAPATDAAGWATDDADSFDPATGWAAPAEAAAPATGEGDSPWEAPTEEEFDWTAGDQPEAWAAPRSDGDPAEDVTSAEAAWEAPEDEATSWTSPDEPAWEAPAAEESEVQADTADFTLSDWATPADEAPVEAPAAQSGDSSGGGDDIPEFVWDPVDEVEVVDESDVAVAEPAVLAASNARVETAVLAAAPVAGGGEAEFTARSAGGADTPGALEAVAVASVVVAEPAVAAAVVEAPSLGSVEVAEPASDASFGSVASVLESAVVVAPGGAVEAVEEPVVSVPPPVAVEVPAVAVVDEPVVAVAVEEVPVSADRVSLAVAGASVPDPVSRWASMMPGGVERRPAVDPTASWARLRPGPAVSEPVGAVAVAAAPAASPVAVALAPSAAPSVAWWDVPSGVDSDPRRGRFALGGYALQPGHQVVSGVTFRDGVVPAPTHWVIGPVVGAVAPGTLVLEVDGSLNCRPEDLAVLMDPGFAPTSDGFSLKLTASAQGPFAASGTYIVA